MTKLARTIFFNGLYIMVIIISLVSTYGCGSTADNDILQTDSSVDKTELVRAGFIGKEDGFTYYTNYKDSGRLCRIKENGRDDALILDEGGTFLGIKDGLIYYTSNYYDGYILYRIKGDGSGKEQVSTKSINSPSLNGNYIYYTDNRDIMDETDTIQLFRMKTDGTEITRLAAGMIEPHAYGKWIFFINPNDNNKLYRTSLNAIGSMKLCEISVEDIFPYDDYVYYIGISDKYGLYRVKTDGTKNEIITELPEGSTILNVYEDRVYYEDARKGIYYIDINNRDKKLLFYTWNVPVRNWRFWGIDSNKTGMVIENLGGFVPLYKALDYISGYQIPGYRLASSYSSPLDAKIRDIMEPEQVENLKDNFQYVNYVYPSGLYIGDKLVQGRLVLGVEDTVGEHSEDILVYLADNYDIRPFVVVFTTLEDGMNVRIDSIGYITEDTHYVQKFHENYYYGYDSDLSVELSDTVFLQDENEYNLTDGADVTIKDKLQKIYVDGLYSSDEEIYTAEVGVYLTEKIDKEERIKVLNQVIGEIRNRYENSWLNIVLFYCSPVSGDLINREMLAVVYSFPKDNDIRIIY